MPSMNNKKTQASMKKGSVKSGYHKMPDGTMMKGDKHPTKKKKFSAPKGPY